MQKGTLGEQLPGRNIALRSLVGREPRELGMQFALRKCFLEEEASAIRQADKTAEAGSC